MAVTVGTRRALEKAREKMKKTRFFVQGGRTDVNHKSSRLTHDKLKRPENGNPQKDEQTTKRISEKARANLLKKSEKSRANYKKTREKV